jgi:uncharacterized protein DUF1440
MPRSKRPLAVDLVLGAVAGAGATWAMDQVMTAIYERQPEESLEQEEDLRDGKTAYELAADKGAKLAGKRLSSRKRKKIGRAIHWSLGVSSGALYGVLRNRIRYLGMGSGVAYGLAFYLLVDEAALTALGITPSPNAFPWQTHARGLAGHLVLGAVLDAAFDAADLVS